MASDIVRTQDVLGFWGLGPRVWLEELAGRFGVVSFAACPLYPRTRCDDELPPTRHCNPSEVWGLTESVLKKLQ